MQIEPERWVGWGSAVRHVYDPEQARADGPKGRAWSNDTKELRSFLDKGLKNRTTNIDVQSWNISNTF